ncbi:MAG: oligosaccharide flippase family protein [Clostridia bacterium]|nr:oligosaccharide flippase family protein [Clostridia bacterium]
MRDIRRFFASAALLTLSALIMRSISVSFSAYAANTAGPEAMGLFSLIMSVFGFGLTVATSGVNLAVTRMVSEAHGQNDPALAAKSMKKCIAYALAFSLFAASALFIFARAICKSILQDERAVLSLRILAISLPFISLTSALNGYFTAVRKVYKNTAYSIAEQLIKIFITVKLFEAFLHKGIEYACIAMVAADAISEFSAFLISFTMYYFDKDRSPKEKFTSVPDSFVKKKLCSIALPVAFSTYIRSGLLTIEHILIPKGLAKSGKNHTEALSSYGMLHSMVMPVILFPTAILSSFAGLLIPELAEAKVKNKKALISSIASRAFQYSLIFSFGIAGFLISFSGELGLLIYESPEVSRYIRFIAPLIPVMYLDSVTDAMLKGLGKQVYSMNVNIIDALLSIICVIFLLPKFGMTGYIITIYLTELINAALSISGLLSTADLKPKIFKWVFAPLFSILGASAFSRFIFSFIDLPLSMLKQIIFNGIIMLLFYTVFILISGAMSKRDRVWLKNVIFVRRYSANHCAVGQDARKCSVSLQKERPRSIQKY